MVAHWRRWTVCARNNNPYSLIHTTIPGEEEEEDDEKVLHCLNYKTSSNTPLDAYMHAFFLSAGRWKKEAIHIATRCFFVWYHRPHAKVFKNWTYISAQRLAKSQTTSAITRRHGCCCCWCGCLVTAVHQGSSWALTPLLYMPSQCRLQSFLNTDLLLLLSTAPVE